MLSLLPPPGPLVEPPLPTTRAELVVYNQWMTEVWLPEIMATAVKNGVVSPPEVERPSLTLIQGDAG